MTVSYSYHYISFCTSFLYPISTYHWTHRTVIIIIQFTYYNTYITYHKHIEPQTIHTYQYIWHVQNHRAGVNIKYNHADGKVTYLVSLSRCHEYILNKSSIPSFEIQVNLCEPMTLVSSLNSIKLFLYDPLLKVLKCYIYIYIYISIYLNFVHTIFPQSIWLLDKI